jgi:hypothetical protein
VNQHRRSQAGPHVGRARGEIAEFVVEGVRESIAKLGVQPLHDGERIGHVKS